MDDVLCGFVVVGIRVGDEVTSGEASAGSGVKGLFGVTWGVTPGSGRLSLEKLKSAPVQRKLIRTTTPRPAPITARAAPRLINNIFGKPKAVVDKPPPDDPNQLAS
jgi:hypothetical protein